MKKILCVLMIMVLCLSACAETAGIINPLTEYGSLAELNELFGCNLCHPAVMGVINESFWTVNCGDYLIAQYVYEVNGIPYTFRCAPTTEDITGIYTVNGTAFPDEPAGEIEFYGDPTVHAARWFDVNGQYALIAADNDSVMSDDTFMLIAMEMRDMTAITMNADETDAYYNAAAGEYQDSFSGRASASVKNVDGDHLLIVVSWADSASARMCWTMNAKLYEDGLLSYCDCRKQLVTADENGVETAETLYENGMGSFWFDEEAEILYWSGAEEESCTDCTFEKI